MEGKPDHLGGKHGPDAIPWRNTVKKGRPVLRKKHKQGKESLGQQSGRTRAFNATRDLGQRDHERLHASPSK
eukprot:scaffold826_cov335-Pavlova_lutheri.AAC.9